MQEHLQEAQKISDSCANSDFLTPKEWMRQNKQTRSKVGLNKS